MSSLYTSVLLILATPNFSLSTVTCADETPDSSTIECSSETPKVEGIHNFSYSATSDWPTIYPSCKGQYQSPININVETLDYRRVNTSLVWRNMDKIPDRMKMEKSDIFAEVKPQWNSRYEAPYLTGGPLNSQFYLYNFHFHWDVLKTGGSEHTVNGRRFPMEMHVVYTSNPLGIVTANDSIVVTSFMIKLSNVDNEPFKPIINAITNKNKTASHEIDIKPFALKKLGVNFCGDYAIYSGSLTTPPCTEGVTWIISSQPIYFSIKQNNQIKKYFKSLGNTTGNHRPLQKLNGRKVFYVVAPPCIANPF